MRPPGEIRAALTLAAAQLNAENGASGASWREMAERANVGYLAARRTAENMERAGVLAVVAHDKRAHSRKWVKLYAPGSRWATEATSQDLHAVMARWVA